MDTDQGVCLLLAHLHLLERLEVGCAQPRCPGCELLAIGAAVQLVHV